MRQHTLVALARLQDSISRFDSRQPAVQVGRTLIAASQILTLTVTPWTRLTPQVLDTPAAPICRGVTRPSLFCLTPDDQPAIALVVALVVLAAVCAGVVPRVTGLAHAWVSYSIAVSLGLPDGGEQAAQVVTVLLIGLTVADERVIAWRRSPAPAATSVTSVTQGIAFASWWLLRLQVAGIYLHSAIAKLGVEDWVNGSALYYVVRDPSFGASGPVGEALRTVTSTPLGVATLTWGTIVTEAGLAVLLLMGPRARRVALTAALVLHVGIIVGIGLWSFALIMIGSVWVAADLPVPARSASDRPMTTTWRNQGAARSG